MESKLSWGIIGAGRIAGVFAEGVAGSDFGDLVAVADIDAGRARDFAGRFDIRAHYADPHDLLGDEQVEAVYVSTPHPFHAEWAVKAAEAGKHVLVEKPMGLNRAEAMAVVEAARANDVFLAEGYMYRCHPQTARLVEIIRDGAIGDVRVIQADFAFDFPFDPAHRLLNQALGGGGILDVGGYPVSLARLIAGVAAGKDFDEPVEVKAVGHIGPVSRVDEYTTACLKFESGVIAQVGTGAQVNMENVARIYGSKGWILVPSPWIPTQSGGTSTIVLHEQGSSEPEEIRVEAEGSPWSIEARAVAAHISDRQLRPPAMTWDDSLGNMMALDMWRESIGLVYDSEKPSAQTQPVSRRPLGVSSSSKMSYGQVEGVGKDVSRLIMGCDNQRTMPHAAVMFDDFFERGGNCFDTAYIYGGGHQERLLGHWMKNRGLREKVVVLGKAAHTPHCYPHYLRPQLEESLDRLQTDHVDIFLAHRDNPEVPVGEFVDAFNQLLRDGLIRSYGGSNWSIERVQAANEYAVSNGLVQPAAVSNNFSLARMLDPVWPGCVASSDPESREWFRRRQLPLLAWSSQARGFFTERAAPDDRSDSELVRCWYSEENFRRQQRARELADKLGVLPINIALAYVLAQPFPTFALIGPRTLAETRAAVVGLEVRLSPQQLLWLDLEG